MATRGNAGTEKAATRTSSRASTRPPAPAPTTPPPTRELVLLRGDAPEVRTLEQLQRVNEQVLDAILRGVLSPKQSDGTVTTLKAIKSLQVDTPLRVMGMIANTAKAGTARFRIRAVRWCGILNLPAVAPPAEAGQAFITASDLGAPSAPPTP